MTESKGFNLEERLAEMARAAEGDSDTENMLKVAPEIIRKAEEETGLKEFRAKLQSWVGKGYSRDQMTWIAKTVQEMVGEPARDCTDKVAGLVWSYPPELRHDILSFAASQLRAFASSLQSYADFRRPKWEKEAEETGQQAARTFSN